MLECQKDVLPSGQSPSQGVYQVRESSVETTVTLRRSVDSLLLGCTAELRGLAEGSHPHTSSKKNEAVGLMWFRESHWPLLPSIQILWLEEPSHAF